jgi:hemolysin III
LEPQNNIHVAGVADPVSAGTHVVAFLATLGGSSALVKRTAQRRFETILVLVYSLATLAQYGASIAYHTSEHDLTLRRIDHATVYVLIAGTFTPLAGAQLVGSMRAFVLGSIWTAAALGVTLKIFFFGFFCEGVDTALYLGAGWFGLLPTIIIWRNGDVRSTKFIMGGAVFYTAGALFELTGWPHLVPRIFNFHEVFHLCVMAATCCFFAAVWRSVGPGRAVTPL